jgi:hypothetical protein
MTYLLPWERVYWLLTSNGLFSWICYSSFQPSYHNIILWHIDPLLGKDLETNNETTATAMQRCSKHASTTIELLSEMVFCTWFIHRGYKEDSWSELSVESQPVKRRLGGWCEIATSLGFSCQLRDEFCTMKIES